MKNSLEQIANIAAQAAGALSNLNHQDGSVRKTAIAMVRDALGRIHAEANQGMVKK